MQLAWTSSSLLKRLISITRVPNTPTYIKGVINLRGVVTPIVDLRERFGMEVRPLDDSSENHHRFFRGV